MTIENLITDNIDIWTVAIKKKSATGRGSSKKIELYGVKKLRELILELAVRGKLVPQELSDEPASVLLERIAEEKAQLVKDKKIKKPKKLPEISNGDRFISLPEGWEFVRLNDLGEWGAGATPRRGNTELYGGDIPWFKSGELNADYISKSTETVTELALKQASLRYNKAGDVLLAMYGATIGKTSILEVKATTNQAVCACTPFTGFSNVFLLTLLKAYRPRFIGMGAGGAQPNISREKIIATVIALPPLAEQHRIVAKVDELMVLCDQLEQQTESSIDAHKTLVEVLLATLTDSKNANDLNQNWARVSEFFDTLFTTEHSIDQLKQTILQLAVMGKLVLQDPSDEPASKLLERIAAEKAQLIKDKKIKKQKALPPISEEEKPFAQPEGWEWERLTNISHKITDGAHHTPKYIEKGVPFLSVKDMSSGKIDFSDTRYISQEQHLELYKRCDPEMGDLLLTKVGTTGIPILIETEKEFSLFVSVALIKFPIDKINGAFLSLLIKSPLVKSQSDSGTQGVGNKNLVLKTISNFSLIIPPLEEQGRIVVKVEELMKFCEQLKSRLNEAQQTQLHLADALVEKAV